MSCPNKVLFSSQEISESAVYRGDMAIDNARTPVLPTEELPIVFAKFAVRKIVAFGLGPPARLLRSFLTNINTEVRILLSSPRLPCVAHSCVITEAKLCSNRRAPLEKRLILDTTSEASRVSPILEREHLAGPSKDHLLHQVFNTPSVKRS
ncbi:hypothetical protein RRG08_023128 [Elysia crispata]|uniref:Uncharacterized protein n=1 Tax=Elysia crispata TaxID=231223 RepID=A0AAE0XML9_9GAST|nr:hypothetical protein RRG08_023128 [Elysia crispata]